MNQREILRKIGGIITELKEQHTYLEDNSDSFNDLELELFMANANFLTDHIEILKKVHGQAKSLILPTPLSIIPTENTPNTKPVIPDYFSEEEHLPFADDLLLRKLNDFPLVNDLEPEQAKLQDQEPLQEDVFLLPEKFEEDEEPAPFTIADASFTAQKLVSTEKEDAIDTFVEPEAESIEPIRTEPVMIQSFQENAKIEPIIFDEEPKPIILEPELPKPEPLKQEFVKTESVIPEPEPALTLNERIAAQKGLAQQLTAKMETSGKISQNLPSLITLNDKLLFIKELFNGYNLAYSEAINILNRYTNFEQAKQFLKANYADKNNWKDKPVTAERFYDLLRQKFS